jgi:hypothetical protein
VSRFREQGDRVGDIAARGFDQRKAAQDYQREQQAALACILGMMMTVVAVMSVMMMVAAVPMLRVLSVVPMLGALSVVPMVGMLSVVRISRGSVTFVLRAVVIVPVLM